MQIELTDAGDPATREAVLAPLQAHNAASAVSVGTSGHLAIWLRGADNELEGGLYASHWFGWMKVEYVFVPEHRRGRGVGQRLVATLEHAARARGCRGVWLNSFSVQAPGFYEKLGYRVVGRLADKPLGGEDVFLAKDTGLGQMPASLVIDPDPQPEDRDVLRQRLWEYTNSRLGVPYTPGHAIWRPLAVVVRGDDGEIRGGLWGATGRSWLYVDLLGLPPDLRASGLGSRLLRMAEEEARERGCIGVHLDTFTFQARPFYEKQGYSLFGQVDNYPDGHTRFFMSKRLDA